ncbi:ROK family transcriptional regulator [Streptomyces sp. NRRL B-24572]|uniref:ROK family transcriptional regulator n=1 Tax=Streptomyces sp. NRRL B-24572 TaxID=1962156 RepID=UPI00211AF10F|nr:ROK family transcriptional regulator [Streptomyces sp. NRRL B-24572]
MNDTALTGGDPTLLRRLNTEAVLRVLRTAEPMTLTQIGKAAGLSRQTVDVVIDELTEGGWIEQIAPERTVGRPARRYRFRAEGRHVLGIDIGVTGATYLLADLDGTVLASSHVDIATDGTSEDRLEAVRLGGAALLADRPDVRLGGLALGVPAIVDAYGLVRLSTPLPEWNGLDLVAEASTWFGCAAHVENDANLAALAEHWQGAAQGATDFIQLIAGRRSGAGMMLGGRLHRGRGGAAGEIGALDVLGWESEAIDVIRNAPDPAGLFADARAGDAEAAARVDRFARVVAQGLAAMILTVNPDLVVIGGGLSQAGEAVTDPIRTHLDRICLDPPEVTASVLGTEAVSLGAVRLALEHLNVSLFGSHGTASGGVLSRAVPAGGAGTGALRPFGGETTAVG